MFSSSEIAFQLMYSRPCGQKKTALSQFFLIKKLYTCRDEWMNEWYIYIVLYCVSPKHFTITGGGGGGGRDMYTNVPVISLLLLLLVLEGTVLILYDQLFW